MSFIADVFDCLLIDKNNEVLASTTLQNAEINVQVQESEVRGGKNNNLLGILHSSRDIEISLTDATFNFEWLAKQIGSTIQYKPVEAYATPEFKKVVAIEAIWNEDLELDENTMYDENQSWDENESALNFLTYLFGENDWVEADEPYDPFIHEKGFLLNGKPIDNSLIVYDLSGQIVDISNFTVHDKFLEYLNGTIGDWYEFKTYKYLTTENSQVIEIDNSVLRSNGFKLVLETIEIDEEEREISKIQFIFDEVRLRKSFTINTSANREQYTRDISLRVLKPRRSNKIGRVVRIPIEN